MLVSALCNMSVLLALGVATVATQRDWGGLNLQAGVVPACQLTEFDLQAIDDSTVFEVPPPSSAAGPVRLFEDVSLATSDFAALAAETESAAVASGMEGLALIGSGEIGSADGKMATEFFGIGGYGQTFVYVVDASGSMNDQSKFDRARYELLRSIEQLNSDQRFYVIFYNDDAYPMNADEPVLATEEHIGELSQWVVSAQANHGTNPLPALLYALSLRPDAIFFLSDGLFDPTAVNELRYRNRRKNRHNLRQIPIHTIAFTDRIMEAMMRRIAKQSGGEYRFVE